MRHVSLLTATLTAAVLLVTPACGKSPQDVAGANAPAQADADTSRAAEFGRFVLPSTRIDGIAITELSGLAWDEDEQLLYAVSDKGYVYHFRLKLDGNTIVASEPVYAAALVDPKGDAPRKGFNAEGLTARNADNGKPGDTELVVSLEGDPPSVARFNPAGAKLGALPVPAPADDIGNYRKKGRGLESVAFDPAHGLMTAPESPLLGQPDDRHTLYAGDGQWSFARHSPDSRLKAFDLLADGNLLVLERSRAGAKDALTASVRTVNLAACPADGNCAAETLAVLPTGPDNFEGMTLVDPHHVLLVSDNGGKGSQDTVFVLVPRP